MQLVIASHNLHKILELKTMLKGSLSGIDILSLRDFPEYVSPEETEDSFVGNAELKACRAAKTLGLPVIADDSGLVVPFLGGLPGVKSARYAGEEATDKDNRNKLIGAMKDSTEEQRDAYFECALSLATPEKLVKTVTGYCEGYLTLEPKGRNGFGYDPLFIKYDYNKTLAELDAETKNRISHRRKALDKLLITLESTLLCST